MSKIQPGHKTLGELIKWLESQPYDCVVRYGFGEPHSDRGDYSQLAFSPVTETTIGAMLEYAHAALGQTFSGWKGGKYTMNEYTLTKIGYFGQCGEPITMMNFVVWSDLARVTKQRDELRADLARVTKQRDEAWRMVEANAAGNDDSWK